MPKPEAPGHRRDYVGRHQAPGRIRSGYKLVSRYTPRHAAPTPVVTP